MGRQRVDCLFDSVEAADAVAVLGGGGSKDRPFAAADYYRRGLVPKVLLASARTSPSVKLGVSPSDLALSRAVLTELGVPETAIETFGNDLSSTFEEVHSSARMGETQSRDADHHYRPRGILIASREVDAGTNSGRNRSSG